MWLFLQEAKDTKLIEAKIFTSVNGTGVAVLTSSYRIFLVNSVKEPKVRRLAEVPGKCFVWVQWCEILWYQTVLYSMRSIKQNGMHCLSGTGKSKTLVSWTCLHEKIYIYTYYLCILDGAKKYDLVTSYFLYLLTCKLYFIFMKYAHIRYEIFFASHRLE